MRSVGNGPEAARLEEQEELGCVSEMSWSFYGPSGHPSTSSLSKVSRALILIRDWIKSKFLRIEEALRFLAELHEYWMEIGTK
jgi:hypothetical protein